MTTPPRRVRLHIQNMPPPEMGADDDVPDRSANIAFRVTEERFRAAADRHPDLAAVLDATISNAEKVVNDLDLPLGEIVEITVTFAGIPLLWIPLIYFLERSRRNGIRWLGRILFLGYLACSLILGIAFDIFLQILEVVGV